jgi:hypothetical protein
MQCDVGIASAQTSENRGEQPQESIHGIPPKRTEQQVKPHDIRLKFPQLIQKPKGAEGIIERPAAQDRKVVEFGFRMRDLIRKDGQAEKRIAAQFLGNVKSVLAQSSLAGRESGYQTNFHSLSALQFRPRYSM